jgi:hypothetical protein
MAVGLGRFFLDQRNADNASSSNRSSLRTGHAFSCSAPELLTSSPVVLQRQSSRRITMRLTLLGSTAVALVLALAPASAQMQQKGSEEKAAPQASEKSTGKESAEPKGKGSAQNESKGTKGAEQAQPKEQGKGTAESQPRDKGTKGTAETQPKEQGTKGSAQTQPKEQSSASKSEKSGDRVQLSEQQRTSVHQTVLKEKNVNRVNQVNFSISVGTRVPRSVHLVALPASVISLVPQYRSYQYFVANDEICIVEPSTYEIVEVISPSGKTAHTGDRGGSGTLVLTAEEKHIIIQNVEMRGGSTLALGSLSEGSPVPREARLQAFPEVVVQAVPKVRGFKFFTAENRIAITDEQGGNVALVIDAKR